MKNSSVLLIMKNSNDQLREIQNRTFLGKEELKDGVNKIIINKYDIEGYGKGVEFAVTPNVYYSESRKEYSLLPTEYIDKTRKDFDWNIYGVNADRQKTIIDDFITNFDWRWLEKGKGLYIYSKTSGSGKTLLACCLINELMKKTNVTVKFITVGDLIELSKTRSKVDDHDIKYNKVCNCTVLVLDDIGSEGSKDWIENFLYDFIDHRYNEKEYITIYTSRLTPDKLKLDDSVKSKIKKKSLALPLPEISIRDMKAREENEEFLRDILK